MPSGNVPTTPTSPNAVMSGHQNENDHCNSKIVSNFSHELKTQIDLLLFDETNNQRWREMKEKKNQHTKMLSTWLTRRLISNLFAVYPIS